jgi:nitroreductase
VDTFLAVASKREVREYAGRPIPADAQQRILEAGRIAGSSRKSQPWRLRLLDLDEGERPAGVLTFGYPQRTRDPQRRSAIEWIERADRKPFDEVVQRL